MSFSNEIDKIISIGFVNSLVFQIASIFSIGSLNNLEKNLWKNDYHCKSKS